MNIRIRRMGDGLAGAIVATAILAGGAAYAASGVIDDNPKGDTPATDDRVARETASTSSTSSTSSTTIAGGSTATPSTTVDDKGGLRRSGDDSTSSTTIAGSSSSGRNGADDGPAHDLGDDKGGDRSSSTSSTSTSTTVVSTPVVRTLQSAGGSVTIRQTGDQLELVAATPAAGWKVDVHHSAGREIDVRFENGKRESRVKVEIEDGVARDRVEDR